MAKVSGAGVVTATGTGNCTITILADGGVTSTVAVNVVALNRSSLTMRQYDTETLIVEGTTATATWYSSNPRVATVVDGKVGTKRWNNVHLRNGERLQDGMPCKYYELKLVKLHKKNVCSRKVLNRRFLYAILSTGKAENCEKGASRVS